MTMPIWVTSKQIQWRGIGKSKIGCCHTAKKYRQLTAIAHYINSPDYRARDAFGSVVVSLARCAATNISRMIFLAAAAALLLSKPS